MALPPPSPSTTVVITGASSGIGTELARELAARRHNVTLVARRADRLERLAGELRDAHGTRVDVLPCDLADMAARERMLADLDALDTEIIGLCNNAGFGTAGRLDRADLDREREMILVNVEALHHLTGALLPALVRRGAGAILNVASIAAAQPLPHFAGYTATKAFVVTFSESLHGELAGTGVSVTTLSPGPTPTEFSEIAGIAEMESNVPAFVQTPPSRVARLAVDAMQRGRRSITPGPFAKMASTGGRFVPRTLLLPVARTITRDV